MTWLLLKVPSVHTLDSIAILKDAFAVRNIHSNIAEVTHHYHWLELQSTRGYSYIHLPDKVLTS